jgi:hypothetical protein
MTGPGARPPLTGDERTQLIGWLDLQRSLVRGKCEGLSEADAYRKLLPTSPLMTVAGLVSHMRWIEYSWFHEDLLGVPDTGQTPRTEGGPQRAEMMVDGIPLGRLLDEYDEECARSNEIVAGFSLDDVQRAPDPSSGDQASVRYILCHMIEETARHLGHLDILRELLDGKTG